jgi:hypothetical protein
VLSYKKIETINCESKSNGDYQLPSFSPLQNKQINNILCNRCRSVGFDELRLSVHHQVCFHPFLCRTSHSKLRDSFVKLPLIAIKMTHLPDRDLDHTLSRVRERQWIYLGPIMAAPIAHIAVTLYRSAKTPQKKQWILGVGVIGSTVVTVGMHLMAHAGYPGGPNYQMASREHFVTEEEKRQIENPDAQTILKQAFRGFG